MKTFQINLIKAVEELKKRFPNEQLKCLETGTLRNPNHNHSSTLHISNTLGDKGTLISIDMNPEAIKVSKEVCKHNTNVEWVLSDSLDYLVNSKDKFHFVFLDSVNCKETIFKEFKSVMPYMLTGGILIVDDAAVHMDGGVNTKTTREKGHKITAFLMSLGISGFIVESPIGTQLWIDITETTLKTILENLHVQT
jgi:hypothetical protein